MTIGNATLYLGDCFDVLPSLPKAGAVVTDPPYGLGKRLNGGTWGNNEHWDCSTVDLEPILAAGEIAVIWGGNYYALPPSRGWLCWFKPDVAPSLGHFELAWTNRDANARLISHAIAWTREAEGYGFHPTQKPVRVMQWTLEQIGPADTVIDPFMGSGTTGVACANVGRRFIGIEKDPRHFATACERIQAAYAQGRLFA